MGFWEDLGRSGNRTKRKDLEEVVGRGQRRVLKDIIGYGRKNEGTSVRKRIHQRAQCHQ